MNKICLIRLIWVSFLIVLPTCQSRDVEIIESRRRVAPKYYKENSEAEFSFLTESLGFVNDEFCQTLTPWDKFIKTFLMKHKLGYEASALKITQNYFDTNMYTICFSYLSDPIFAANKIFLYTDNERNTIVYELKRLEFKYFSREVEFVKVIRCPVTVNKQETQLYFQETDVTWNSTEHAFRTCFVFANVALSRSNRKRGLIEIIMSTGYFPKPLPDIDETGDEAELGSSRNLYTSTIPISFTVQKNLSTNHFKWRLFGERAELYFLAQTYGFINRYGKRYWRMKEMMLTLERMRRGYEVNSQKMKKERENNSNYSLCDYYNSKNFHLPELGIQPMILGQTSEDNWVTKSVKFPIIQIPSDGLEREILQCPVSFIAEQTLGYIYLLPIHYKRKNKLSQLITFINNENNSDEVYPIVISIIAQVMDEHNDSKSESEVGGYETEIPTFPEWQTFSGESSSEPLLN